MMLNYILNYYIFSKYNMFSCHMLNYHIFFTTVVSWEILRIPMIYLLVN